MSLFEHNEGFIAYKNEVKAAVLLAKVLQKVYYFYTDLSTIVTALIISIYAKHAAEVPDAYLDMPFSQIGGCALAGYQTVKNQPSIPENKVREIKFCIAWAFEPLDSSRKTKSANSVIVHFIMLMLEDGFVENELDKDILLTATPLHDIGKLQEMQTTPLGKTEYTDDGKLFNHLHLGVQMVLDESGRRDYDTRLIHNVVHCIASHHGKLDWSAIVEPATPEAKILFLIDGLDSQIEPVEAAMPGMEIGEVKEIPYQHLTVFKTKEHFK
jgi:3'-5' exoribonuclease